MKMIKTTVLLLLTFTSAKSIYTGDNIISQQADFLELMDAATNMYQHLSSSEALIKMMDIPEFRKLTGASPFEQNNITEIIDKATGSNVAFFDWDKIHQENKRLIESNAAKGPSGTSIDEEWNTLIKQSTGLKSRGRKLGAFKDALIEEGIAQAAGATIDLVRDYIEWTISAHDEVSNYDEIYEKINAAKGLSASSMKKLDSAEKKKDAAKNSIKLAFTVVKASVFDLYSTLKGHYTMFDLLAGMQGDVFEQSRTMIEKIYVERSKEAIIVFRRGVMSTEHNIENAKNHVKAGEKIVEDVQEALTKESKVLKDNADGKSEDFKDFKMEQRAIAYGTCTGITLASFGAGAAPCFATAALILETKINEYQGQQDKMWRDVNAARNEISTVLKRADKLDVSFDNCKTKIKMLDGAISGWVNATKTDQRILAITKDKKQLDYFCESLADVHNSDKYQIADI